ncbi:ATP synthase subunit b precursor [bacterium BMS3Bbin10]|nr:ATP synthase subunit b precursor [bacterium BMS3Bbin10]
MGALSTPEFWIAASFFGFILLIVYYKVPGMVTKALDDRADTIRKELDEARRLREEAQTMLADYERKHRDAEKEVESIILLANQEAKALAVETRQKIKDQLERRTRLAEDKISHAEKQAIGEVRAAAVTLAISAAERIIAKKMSPAASKKLVDQSIKDLKTKLN